jgi:GT2 family glycosyltransferase
MATSVETTSVIIVTYNNEKTIERCLQHILSAAGDRVRVVVVDNASADSTVEIVSKRFPSVKLIANDENLGFAAGNNMGIKASDESTYIALINPDAFLLPGWFETMIDAARKWPEHGSYGSFLLSEDGSHIDGCGDILHFSGHAWRHRQGQPYSEERDYPGEEIFSPCAAAALYRRDALLAAGCFDEDFFCYFEDVDLGFRLQLAGYPSRFVPEAQALHLGFGSSGERSSFAVYHGHRNMVYNLIKNMPPLLLLVALPAHLLVSLLTLIGFTMVGKGGAYLRAKWHGFTTLGSSLAKRSAIQKSRRVSSFYIAGRLRWFGLLYRNIKALMGIFMGDKRKQQR